MADAITSRKQDRDFTKEVSELVPIAEAKAESGAVSDAIEQLLALEKQTRNAADLSSTSRLLKTVVSILFRKRDLAQLRAQIVALARKHGQLKQAVTDMVEESMTYVDQLEGTDKIELIETLREVTDGKIYVEVPRARLTRQLATIREAAGEHSTVNTLMQDLQVETFGSMDRREKIDFILEQMRLLRLMKDWEKLAIVSKKINSKWLAEEANEDLKLRFYALMISYALHTAKYLDLCKYYRAVYDSPTIQADQAKWSAALRNVVFFVVLAPHDNEQSDLLNRVAKDDKLQTVEGLGDIVKCFTTSELMRWPGVQELYGPALRRTKVFGPAGTTGVDGDVEEADEGGEARWEELHSRVVEHNVRVVSNYYTRLTLHRLAELLDLPDSEAERVLARLVASGTVYARIDRPSGLVNFQPPQSTAAVLNEWNRDVGRLLSLVEKTDHLIRKDRAWQSAVKSQRLRA